MAREFDDGFEGGDTTLWSTVSGATIVAAVSGMSGSYCLDLTGNTDYAERVVTERVDYYFKIRYRPISGAENILTVYQGTSRQCGIFRSGSVIKAYRGSEGTVIATGVIPININTTYLIEVYILIDNTNGRIVLKVDGIADSGVDFTGDTQNTGTATITKFRLGYTGQAGVYAYAYFDDVVVDNANWIGNSRIQVGVPTGAGTTTQWTPSAGSNWQTVDEVPASDADYNSINANDQLDTFATGNLTGTINNIKCVQIHVRAWKEGAVTPQNLKIAVRSGGTNYLSGDNAVPDTNPTGLYNIWETDPNTAAAWTEANVNAAEIGYKSAA